MVLSGLGRGLPERPWNLADIKGGEDAASAGANRPRPTSRKVRTMTVPGSNPVQFVPNSGDFTVDSISDPGGAPSNILDVDLGFVVSGTVTLPNFLSGKAKSASTPTR
jgi:hypothetical protein